MRDVYERININTKPSPKHKAYNFKKSKKYYSHMNFNSSLMQYCYFCITKSIFFFSFKKVLTEVTSSKDSTIQFLHTYGVLKSSILCPGPSLSIAKTSPCGHYMVLKKINDSKDGET